jgi:hypothetical protein
MRLRASALSLKWGRPVACGRRIRRPPCAAQLQNRDRQGAVLPACVLLALFAAGLCAAPRFSFHVLGNEAAGWGELLSSIGMTRGSPAAAGVFVAPQGTDAAVLGTTGQWTARVEQGAILVLEGESPLAAAFGFRPSASLT